MRREQFKLVSAILLLSGFSTGYMQAAPHAAATGVSIVQQDNTCKGVVLDQNGESVIGASVVVKGTTNGGITGMDGDFIISNVKKGDIIVISFVGYAEQEIVWDGKPMKVTLQEDTETLDEVVVVGYGVQKKSHLTGSVSKMDVNNLTDIPVTQVDQLLQGKIAGVNIRTPLPRPELLRKSVYVVWVLSVPTVLR